MAPRYFKNVVLLVLTLILGNRLMADHFKSEFINYSVNEGLPSSQVYQIIQDSKGYLWFGTDRGLVRYNGYEFKIFTVDDGLSSNVIFHLDEGPNNTIWMYGKDRRIYYFKNDQIKPYKYNDFLEQHISNNTNLLSLEVDEKALKLAFWDDLKANIYFEIQHNGLNDVRQGNPGLYIDEHEDGIRVYFNSRQLDSIYYNEVLLEQFIFSEERNENKYSDVVRIDSILYLSAGKRVLAFEIKNNLVEDVVNISCNAIVTDLELDGKGNIYIGTLEGLYKLIPEKDNKVELMIPDRLISSVLVDNSGGVWAGSIYKGIFYCPTVDNKHIKAIDDRVTVMFAANKRLFYARYSGKILEINGDVTTKIENSKFKQRDGGQHGNIEYIIFPNDKGKSYVVDTVENVSWEVPLAAKKIMWVPKGYAVYDNREIRFVNTSYESQVYYKTTGFLNSVEFYTNEMWIVGMDDGVKLYDKSDLTFIGRNENQAIIFKTNMVDYKSENPFFRTRINDILRINDSTTLFASGESGLYIEKKYGKDIIINKKEGLVSNLLDKIFYFQGRIVATSKEGLSLIDPNYQITNYTNANNLLSNDIRSVAIIENEMYVLSDLGISKFSIEAPTNPVVPIHLVNFKVGESKRELRKVYELDYSENSIEISFEGLSFIKEGKVNYRYKLTGVDQGWVYTDSKNVRYTNLPAGNFEFLVAVENPDQTWTASTSLIAIKKKVPFWEHWAFIVVMVLLGGLLISLIIFLINKRQLRIQKDKYRVLNLERKTLQAQINPHFIFNSLTSLQNLIIKGRKLDSQEYLGKFADLTRLALNHSTKNYIAFEDEVALIENYIELEKIRFGNGFDYDIKVTIPHKNKVVVSPMLVQPFVENAILHGLAAKKSGGMLKINFAVRNEETLLCTITDNGVGRSAAKSIPEKESLGIRLIKERLGILLTEEGIKITDLIEEGKPVGTCVTLILPYKIKMNESTNY